MLSSWYRVFILIAALVGLSIANGRAADSSHFWTELPDGGHVAKVQSLPDFVDLAAKLSPAVVNISSEEPNDPGVNPEEDEPRHHHRASLATTPSRNTRRTRKASARASS